MHSKAKSLRRQCKQKRAEKGDCLLGMAIFVTDHAVERYRERIRPVSQQIAVNNIMEDIEHSRLIALAQFSGREIREYKGIIYVCEMHDNVLSVITVLLSSVDIRFAC